MAGADDPKRLGKIIKAIFGSDDLECYGCGLTGDYGLFGLPVKCPYCGSYQIWTNTQTAPKE